MTKPGVMRTGLAVVGLLVWSGSVGAEIRIAPWRHLFQGIARTVGRADATEPRRHNVNALRIDVTVPGIQFFATPANGDAALETFGQTASDFLLSSGVQVAVNASFFAPCCDAASGQPKDLIGLAISRGQIVSPEEDEVFGGTGEDTVSLLITEDNQVRIDSTNRQDTFEDIFTAVAGSPRLLADGEIVVPFEPADDFAGPNPRTAVGVSADGRYVYLITIDGRQPGFSDGATLFETAEWLQRFGAYQGLNLDGGGSTTMVVEDVFGNPLVLNRPSSSGNQQRVNGNHVGVFAMRFLGGAVSQMTPTVVRCEDQTTGGFVGVRSGETSWDCDELGLTYHVGDEMKVVIHGIADASSDR